MRQFIERPDVLRRYVSFGISLLCVLLASCGAPPPHGPTQSELAEQREHYAALRDHQRRMRELENYGTPRLASSARGTAAGPIAPSVPMIRIEVIRNQVQDVRRRHKAVGGAYDGDNVRIVKPAPHGGPGVNYKGRHGHAVVHGSAGQSAMSFHGSTGSHILVMDGGVGYLNIGESGPTADKVGDFVVLSRRESGHKLAVRPRMLPSGMIEISVWPAWLARGPHNTQKVEELATTVVVRSGQSFSIGGFDDSGRSAKEHLLARRSRERVDTTNVVLRATVVQTQVGVPTY